MALSAPRARPALAALLALLAAACAHPSPHRGAARALEARGIRIVGAKEVERDDVAALVRCERAGTPGIACDLDELWGLYDRRGHPRARFSLRRLADRDGQAVHELVVDEGPRFRVAEVRVAGLEDVPASRAWLEALPLRRGALFSAYVYLQTKDELLAALRGAGFGEAEVAERMDVELRASVPGSYAVTVTYDVEHGPGGEPWRVGAVAVADPDPGRRARIERDLSPLLRRGEPFDYARLLAARTRLGAYSTAAVLVAKPDEARREIPILVRVAP